MLNEIEKTVTYYARITSRYSKTLEFDDVKQSLYLKVLTVCNKQDDKKGDINTFISRVVKNECIDLHHETIKADANLFFTDFSNIDIGYEPIKNLNTKMYLDEVEKALTHIPGNTGENALKVFQLMREGYNQNECSKKLNFTRGYISKLFKEEIKPMGLKILI